MNAELCCLRIKLAIFAADWQDTVWMDLGAYTFLRCDYASHPELRGLFWVLPDGRNVSDARQVDGVQRYDCIVRVRSGPEPTDS